MAQSYQQTVRRIVDAYSGLTPELRKAAKFILENPEEIGLNSMRRVARGAGVKPATMSRLSQRLGFARYQQLREPFQQRLRKREPEFASAVVSLQRRGAGENLFKDLRAQELENVERSLSQDNLDAIMAAAEAMNTSRRVYVLGLRGAHAPAFLFHYAYQLFQDNSYLIDTHAGIFADQLRGVSARDSLLVVSFPPYTQLTIDAVDYAAEAGANIVAITDSVVSPVASAADQTIVAQHKSASFYHSFTGVLAVVQALITMLVARKGGDAVQIVKDAERQLSKVSAYW